ncbi:hypothetical protein DFJ77DRAFT_437829 [Powellomyces hirtus]|nr:hypothetical protein DFJ77DRAFT_437829 [Powellomyces hirtus]
MDGPVGLATRVFLCWPLLCLAIVSLRVLAVRTTRAIQDANQRYLVIVIRVTGWVCAQPHVHPLLELTLKLGRQAELAGKDAEVAEISLLLGWKNRVASNLLPTSR